MSINLTPGQDIDNILIDNPGVNAFNFPPGDYYLNDKLLIDRKNVSFYGTGKEGSVHIFQNAEKDGLDVEADGFKFQKISLHVEHDDKVALTVANCNNIIVKNCVIYGNSTNFTVFFAGPEVSAGSATLNAYDSDNLCMNNVFEKNIIYTKWSGDCVSFSLQYAGSLCNNIIRGGKIAIYMCKYTNVSKNIIYDSVSSGIFLSLPSHNIILESNHVYECQESGIVIKNQQEHGLFNSSDYFVKINKNTVYDTNFHNIEMNDCFEIEITKNKLFATNNVAIYVLRSGKVGMTNNLIGQFQKALHVIQSSNCSFNNNECSSIFPYQSEYVADLDDTNNIEIKNNEIRGKILNDIVREINSVDNEISENTVEQYYTYKEEERMLKKIL